MQGATINMTPEDIVKEIKQLHGCIDDLRKENTTAHEESQKNFNSLRELSRNNHAELKQYFIGVDPERHIKDHHEMELGRSEESDRKSIKNAVVSGVITTIVLVIGGWFFINAMNAYEDKQRTQLMEQIRKEIHQNPSSYYDQKVDPKK